MENQRMMENSAMLTLKDKIKDIRIAMMTTRDDTGHLRSRPMATHDIDVDGTLWFFTKEHSPKVDEIESIENDINLSYMSTNQNLFVSVSGKAVLVKDKAKINELWNPLLKAWFPQGLDDPELALLKVTIDQAEYWDAPSNRMIQVIGVIKAAITGKEYKPGEHGKMNFETPSPSET